MYNVLFLCTGNSARSIMAEAIMNHAGSGRFRAYSAGSHPTGTVNPFALQTLQRLDVPADELRSKAWDEFAQKDAPNLDFVITVCNNAAGEVCPVWPGKPVSAHWGVEDPAALRGSDEQVRDLFLHVATVLKRRIERLIALPIETLAPEEIRKHLREIGTC